MKYFFIGILLLTGSLRAQDSASLEVQHTIERFFEGFHQKDSAIIKSTTAESPILQTIAVSGSGDTSVKTQDYPAFLRSVCSIPDTLAFREVIKDYKISIDGPMANAWTPYEFWLNEKFSHCGVNSFQLVRKKEGWKIIYLIDTRRKDNCL